MILIQQYIRKGQKTKRIKRNIETDSIIAKSDDPKYRVVSKGKPVGLMVAFVDKELDQKYIAIAFTRFHLKKEPIWDELFAFRVVTDRAYAHFTEERLPLFVRKEHPKYVRRQFLRFAERAEKYFKEKELPPWFKYYRNRDLFEPSKVKIIWPNDSYVQIEEL